MVTRTFPVPARPGQACAFAIEYEWFCGKGQPSGYAYGVADPNKNRGREVGVVCYTLKTALRLKAAYASSPIFSMKSTPTLAAACADRRRYDTNTVDGDSQANMEDFEG
jgi:hypothetical protein